MRVLALLLLVALPLRAQSRLEVTAGRAAADTGIVVPRWLGTFVDSPRGAYPVAFCVAADHIDTTDGLHITVDSVDVAERPRNAECNSRPIVYVRPACGLLDGERQMFDESRAAYLLVLCGDGRSGLLLRREGPKRSTP